MSAADELRAISKRISALEAETAAVMIAAQKEIRRAAIMSPLNDAKLAAISGCGREHMNRFRNGRVDANLEMLCALAEFFGVESVMGQSQKREEAEE